MDLERIVASKRSITAKAQGLILSERAPESRIGINFLGCEAIFSSVHILAAQEDRSQVSLLVFQVCVVQVVRASWSEVSDSSVLLSSTFPLDDSAFCGESSFGFAGMLDQVSAF